MSGLPIIGKLISPSAPTPLTAPGNVVNDNLAKQKQAQDEEEAMQTQRRKASSGMASTMLTGGSGTSAPTTSSNILLGS